MKTEQFNKLNKKEKQALYKKNYELQKSNSKRYTLQCFYSNNWRIIHKLEEQDNVAQYIKGLIEKDLTEEEIARYDAIQEQELAKIREAKKNK